MSTPPSTFYLTVLVLIKVNTDHLYKLELSFTLWSQYLDYISYDVCYCVKSNLLFELYFYFCRSFSIFYSCLRSKPHNWLIRCPFIHCCALPPCIANFSERYSLAINEL